MNASRHWVEIQLPQPSDEGDTVGFYVVGTTDEIEAKLLPSLLTSKSPGTYLPCSIIAVESTE